MKIFTKFLSGASLTLALLLPGASYGTSIMTFGDSITQGYPYREEPGNGSRSGVYQSYLKDLFLAVGGDADISNWGLAGETTLQALQGGYDECGPGVDPDCTWIESRSLDSALAGQGSADYILILEGTNDILRGISPQTTATNLCEIAAKAKSYNMEPLIGTLTPDQRGLKDIEGTNEYIKAEAGQRGIKVVDLYAGLVDNWNEYNADGVHPNEYGYKAMAATWFVPFYNLQLTTGTAESENDSQETAKATLTGTVSANAEVFDLAFEYGPDESMEMSVKATPESSDGTEEAAVQAELTDLRYDTTYYYRLTSTLNGHTYHGETKTFVTPEMSKEAVLTGVYLLLLLQNP